MTRILRLLMIAALVLPFFGTAAAQEIEMIPGRSGSKLTLQENPNLEIKNTVAPQTEIGGVKLDPSTIKPKKAPTMKAGGQIYDYYSNVVVNGSRTNENVPFRGEAMGRDRSEGQMIYRTSQMGLQNGDIITGIAFYATSAVQAVDGTTSNLTIRVGETSSTSFSNGSVYTQMTNNRASLTEVYTGPIPTGYQLVEFEFDQPYTYNGSNFIIDIQRNSGDFAPSITWSCEQQSTSYYSSAYSYRGSNNNLNTDRTRYLPTMVVYYKRLHQGTVSDRTIVVKNTEFFAGKEYAWPYNAEPQNQQTSTLDEIATDPDQMIAMMRKVYMDPTIPGNKKRGFAVDGSNTGETNQAVYYQGVGGIKLTGSYLDVTDSYEYDDIYGWGIPGNINNVAQSGTVATESSGLFGTTTTNTYAYYTSLELQQYEPEDEGLTLLLVELKEDYVDGSNNAISEDETSYTTEYERLRAYFQNTVKSVRIISDAKRTGTGFEAGTLFKIDCDKMNKFFLLAKGQLHLDHNSSTLVPALANAGYVSGTIQDDNTDFCVQPGYMFFRAATSSWGSTSTQNIGGLFWDNNTAPLFYHMFEQFSPTIASATAGADDLYHDLVNMHSFPVIHDCLGITQMNHQFLMYGPESEDKDCQDVRDLMFFIPDYRMLYHSSRGSSTQEYLNYHRDIQPSMGLYVIRQNEITPTTEADDYYMLNLDWVTNLDDFLPNQHQEFELLQVVVNDSTGLEEYVPVYYMNTNGEYTDANGTVVNTPVPIVLQLGPGAEKNYPYVYVARQQASQQVTYAIRGRDAAGFLSVQISNRRSYIIPGKDPTELVSLIELSHYSRYNPENEENCYSNRFKLSNNVGGLTRNNMSAAQNTQNVFTFTRKTSSTDENPVTLATATVTNRTQSGGTITIVMQNQAAETEFPRAKNGNGYAGYHANPGDGITWTQNFTYNNINGTDYVNFGDLILCDNFIVDVSANEHPSQYIYEVKFNIVSTTDHNFDEAHGSAFRVPIYKTASKVNKAFSLIEVKGDKDHAIPVDDLTFSERVQYSSKTEILRYDVYRWLEGETRYIVSSVGANDAEQDLAPNGIAGNQGEGYTVTMNDVNGQYYYNGGTVAVSSGTAWADFVDYYPASVAESSAEGKAYVYAPVVETFTVGKNVIGEVRTDYNTYGGPQQRVAVGVIDIDNPQYQISDYSWTKNGNLYSYYTVELPIQTDAVPDGYKIYMVRAWRVIDPELLDEQLDDFADRMTENGEYLFEEILGPNEDGGEYQPGQHMRLGGAAVSNVQDNSGNNIPVYRGTFGARKVRTQTGNNDGCLESLPMTFRVRLYFTPNTTAVSNAPAAGGVAPKAESTDKAYYVAEYTTDFTINGGIPTGIVDVLDSRDVVGVKYYNPAGVESDTPFKGVNIVVTRYSDGSTSTTKILK